MFSHSMQQKGDQGTLGTQRSAPIGSMIRLGPSLDPAMDLQYTQHGPWVSNRRYIVVLFDIVADFVVVIDPRILPLNFGQNLVINR